MSVERHASIGPHCCVAGCRESAQPVIAHPEHGRRVVCWEHAEEFEVIDHVA
ncbi:hypothetical protein [Halalkaliarchaeum desulfuricum]|uniref:hypothetical protein n=1 Tax=Halalkaliarchaeum desulfuricum TaxID=2055893 RepID=UPI0012B61111|nr:hypothetical protein [Halalkaliarchaeum desulfuricum]